MSHPVNPWGKAAAIGAYVATIIAANVMTAHWGLVPVGFGLAATAGTYAAGFALLARDIVHRVAGPRFALAAIGVGVLLSWFLADPHIALASAAAFTAAELADFLVFSRLREHGFIRAAAASNLVSAPIDTLAFLAIAGFPITVPVVAGQLLAKIAWATLVPLALYAGGRRAVLREPVHAEGA